MVYGESEGDSTITISTIPGLDTFVGDTTVFDYDIFPNEIVIHQEIDYCEGDFDNDGDQDGSDAATFKLDFGRSIFLNPCTNDNSCNSDFDCDVDVDGSDAAIFKEDFGRSPFFHPCLFYLAGNPGNHPIRATRRRLWSFAYICRPGQL